MVYHRCRIFDGYLPVAPSTGIGLAVVTVDRNVFGSIGRRFAMISRDTRIHVLVAVVAIGLLVLLQPADASIGDPLWVALVVSFWALLLGGAHLYLAIRGEDGMIPVASRWRYLAALVVVLGGVATISLAGDRSLGPIEVETVAMVAVGLAVLAYVVVEARAGYRDARPS